MKERRSSNLLVEPPSSATGDIAFNLIVFFLVCASVQPDTGLPQQVPKAEEQQQQQEQQEIVVQLTRDTVALNGDVLPLSEFPARLGDRLQGKTQEEDRIVVLQSKPDTPYRHWITVSSLIEQAGGVVTLQIEEERQIAVP